MFRRFLLIAWGMRADFCAVLKLIVRGCISTFFRISARVFEYKINPRNEGVPGGVSEWLKETGCKPVGVRLRWFESNPLHHFGVGPKGPN